MRDSLQTDAVSLAELFANGKRYHVPAFQRSYSWGESEWDDLWRDIESDESGVAAHYMGAIVLQQNAEDPEVFDVIDGQQRLATLAVVLAALLGELASWSDEEQPRPGDAERLEVLRERFLSRKDAVSLNRESRLRLSRADDPFFQSTIINGAEPAAPSRLKNGSKKLWRAQQYFAEHVRQRFGGERDSAAIARFIEERIAKRLTFIRIVVHDEAAAYTVFETLNARGVALGTADLLKNLVLAKAAVGGDADLDEMSRRWDALVSLVPLESLAGLVHHHANTRAKDVGRRRVFKHVRDRLKTAKDAFDYIDELTRAADWYAGLLDPEDELWNKYRGARKWVRVLRILKAEQFRPLALAACPMFDGDERRIQQLLKMIATISFRATTVLRQNSGDVYRSWNRAAISVSSGASNSIADIASDLRDLVGEDSEFEQQFAALAIPAAGPRKKLVRYVLAELESDASQREVDWDADDWTIEHIMPRVEAEAWQVDDAVREANVSRIGNYIPLEPGLNREADQRCFAEKVDVYKKSRYSLPHSVAANEWGPEAIRRRGEAFAKRARHVWRVDQIG